MTIENKIKRERNIISHLNQLVQGFARKNKDLHPAYAYFEPLHALSDGLPVPIFGVMLLIWQLRDQDLQQLYPLDTIENRTAFLSWCACSGTKEYALLRECKSFIKILAEPAFDSDKYDKSDAAHGLSWLIVLTAMNRPDLKVDLSTKSGRSHLLLWYLQYGFQTAGIASCLEEWQVQFLSQRVASGMSMHQDILYRARDDLKKAFKLPAARHLFDTWYAGSDEFKAIASPICCDSDTERAMPALPVPFGVNVIGHISGVSGIAEDSRSALAALRRTTLPTATIDYSATSSESGVLDHRYAVNLFCFPALEQAWYVAEYGLAVIINRYNIGYWPWEISHWPEQWHHLFSLVDEVWASSEHIRGALLPVSPKPVLFMPMVVEVPPISKMTRTDFSLPENDFLFYFSFDLRSSSARKNPEACITAFQKAFPHSTNVGLVIKAIKPQEDSESWEKMKLLTREDPRIHVIDKTLSRRDLMALYVTCNCFISLHRAEGFGRNIAEAMLLKNPVIVTNYSGNLAFTNTDNSLLVPYTLQNIGAGDYPGLVDGLWANPDVNAAAICMQKISEDPCMAERLSAAGHSTMYHHHSVFRIAQKYIARLTEIKEIIKTKNSHELV